jgi:hypothetical protein
MVDRIAFVSAGEHICLIDPFFGVFLPKVMVFLGWLRNEGNAILR